MFYDQFETLCKQTGERPYTLARQLGVASSSIISQWKKGSVPRQPMLEKIAEHFNVSIDYLLTGKEKQPAVSGELFENLLIHGEEKQPAVSDGLSEDEVMLLDLFRSLPEDERQSVLLLLRRAAGRK